MKRVLCLSSLLCLSLAGCNPTKLSAVDGLAFGALAGVVPPPAENVQVVAKVTNVSVGAITVNYTGCAVTPILHSSGFNGPVAFDPRPQACPQPFFSQTLNPGDAVQITGTVVPNLPPGTYFVVALITVNGTTKTLNAGTVTF